jgi:hypothetical protein
MPNWINFDCPTCRGNGYVYTYVGNEDVDSKECPYCTKALENLLEAVSQCLDDMDMVKGNCVCGLAKAMLRASFEPFRVAMPKDERPEFDFTAEMAEKILKEAR